MATASIQSDTTLTSEQMGNSIIVVNTFYRTISESIVRSRWLLASETFEKNEPVLILTEKNETVDKFLQLLYGKTVNMTHAELEEIIVFAEKTGYYKVQELKNYLSRDFDIDTKASILNGFDLEERRSYIKNLSMSEMNELRLRHFDSLTNDDMSIIISEIVSRYKTGTASLQEENTKLKELAKKESDTKDNKIAELNNNIESIHKLLKKNHQIIKKEKINDLLRLNL